MAVKEMKHKDMILALKEAGYTDASIELALSTMMPGTPIPSINSVRRWRYGSTKPSPYYAALLEKLYLKAVSHGVVPQGGRSDQ